MIKRIKDRGDCDTNHPIRIKINLLWLERNENDTKLSKMISINTDGCSVKESTDAILKHVDENIIDVITRYICYISRPKVWKRDLKHAIKKIIA
jgi:hypothetical protein